MSRIVFLSLLGLALAAKLQIATGSNSLQAKGPLGRPYIWADCELFKSVATPATFGPDQGPFDELYGGGNGFKDGHPAISESKLGDQDYNGGRWHLNVLKADVDPDKYSDACSVDDLDLNDFESTDNYLECPLQPKRGQGHQ
jgi:hypothetical protein